MSQVRDGEELDLAMRVSTDPTCHDVTQLRAAEGRYKTAENQCSARAKTVNKLKSQAGTQEQEVNPEHHGKSKEST